MNTLVEEAVVTETHRRRAEFYSWCEGRFAPEMLEEMIRDVVKMTVQFQQKGKITT